jgi:hypothetical protein
VTISPELFFAILSLDSYNRGYDPGVVGLGGLLSAVGNVVLLTDSETLPETSGIGEAASFYAVAYQDASGNIVISYRGTDDPVGDLACWMGGNGRRGHLVRRGLAAVTNACGPSLAPRRQQSGRCRPQSPHRPPTS